MPVATLYGKGRKIRRCPLWKVTASVLRELVADRPSNQAVFLSQRDPDSLRPPRWQRAPNAGSRPQRLLWASTGTKDPKASDILNIKALASRFMVNTMSEGTLKAFADHGDLGSIMAPDDGNCEGALAQFAKAGIHVNALAAQLQDEDANRL
jgi:transaldolase